MSGVQILRVSRSDDDMRLDRWFKLNVPHMTHGALQKALRKGQVRVQGKRAKASDRVSSGQEIRVPPVDENKTHMEDRKPEKRAFSPNKMILAQLRDSIVFENKDLAVLNKPQGLAVQGGIGQTQNVDALLPYLFNQDHAEPKLVHRIDKDTTGLLLVAKNRKTAAVLTERFHKKEIQKRYLALVSGVPHPMEGKIDLPLIKGDAGAGREKMLVDRKKGQRALSHYRVLDYVHKQTALVELEPVTGRTHQLRVHMSAIGHPIIGDFKYGEKEQVTLEHAAKKLHLHAWQVESKPLKGQSKPLQYEAELPEHMENVMEFLALSLK